MPDMIPVTRPELPPLEDFLPYIDAIWKNNILTNDGPLLMQFEEVLSNRFGGVHVICTANGTLALQVAVRALELKGEIITTPFTFIATSSALIWEGCQPVYVDIDPKTMNIDPTLIAEAVTEKTTAILPVHVYGYPCQTEAIGRVASQFGLKILYDAAHCFDSSIHNRSLLTFGDASIASFHATKAFQTGEGGAIFTQDGDLAHRCRLLRNFGYENYQIHGVGINAKMQEISAALGLAGLKYTEDFRNKRIRLAEQYVSHLEGLKNLHLLDPPFPERAAYFPVLCESEVYRINLIQKLNSENIYPRAYFDPSLETVFGDGSIRCPNAHRISKQVLCLPIYASLGMKDVERICGVIRKV